jgi:hypothetical protein
MYIDFGLEDLLIVVHGILLIKFFLAVGSFLYQYAFLLDSAQMRDTISGSLFHSLLGSIAPKYEGSKSLSLGIDHMSNQTLTTERLAVTHLGE